MKLSVPELDYLLPCYAFLTVEIFEVKSVSGER
jgi:hypothetical protein